MARVGRPSLYKPEYVELGRKYCLLGATDPQLAKLFDVSEATIDRWRVAHPEFRAALKAGKDEADAVVANSLYRKAIGYELEAVKIFGDPKTGAELMVPYTEKYAPDTTACIFWLKNRRPDLWRDRVVNEHTGKDGGPIQTEDVSARDLLASRITGLAARVGAQPAAEEPDASSVH